MKYEYRVELYTYDQWVTMRGIFDHDGGQCWRIKHVHFDEQTREVYVLFERKLNPWTVQPT